MGVPALFRWLSKKYPKIISPVVEELPQELDNGDGTKTVLPVDARKPNPNGEEMDNLYLDMNGIVHPCSHPEDRPPPANEEEMMIAVFEYTERVVNMVRPRKLLMIAVDGVAPRAKMNQQRSRRFRSAQEAADKDKATAEYHAMLKASGRDAEIEGGEKPKKTWDSNAITPGTPFMNILAQSLRYWVSYKLSTDPAWEKLKVIISDATVPGEGEHKIMNFVRSQRSSPTHDPNTRHVIYGLDADLIMLGIATHEPHFRVLREDVFANDTKPGHCRKCNQPGHMADQCRGAPKPKPGEEVPEKPLKPFIWLHVGILREYLAVEMSVPAQKFRFDLERALDDWVFMCFFVGNDFLPHLPSLDIREDGIDTLIAIWRDNIPAMGGYVTKDGHVDLTRAQVILEGLAKQEDAIFKRRRENEVRKEERDRRNAERNDRRQSNKRARFSGGSSGFDESVIQRGAGGGIRKADDIAPDMNALPMFALKDAQTKNDPRYQAGLTHADVVGGTAVIDKANADNRSAAAALKDKLKNGTALGKRTASMREEADEVSTDPSTPGRNTPNIEISRGTSGALGGNSSEQDMMPEDTVKLWENGYQGRYYEQKFHVSPDDVEFRHKVARSYVEGLAWVLLYYMQGCPSWTWYYPYHYAPFGADFQDMDKQVIKFDKGGPFRPYEQLMGVMPAASNHTIPAVFHPLMTDEDSSIKEFYPVDFDVDLNGKKFAWQGVALLPFIDEKRLLDAMATKYPLLTEDEKRRNAFGEEALIFSTKHPLYPSVSASFFGKKAGDGKLKLNHKLSEGLHGKIVKNEEYIPGSSLDFPLPSTQEKYASLDEDGSVSVHYMMPVLPSLHQSMLLPGVKFGPPVLDYNDIQTTRSKAERSGRSHGGVRLSENGDRSDGRRINYAARDDMYGGNSTRGHDNGHNGRDDRHRGNQQQPWQNLPPGLAAQAAAHGFNQQGSHNGYNGPPQGYPPAQRGGYGYADQGGYASGYGGGHQGGYQGNYQNQGYNNSAGRGYEGGYNQGGYNQGYNGQQGGRNNYNNQGYGNGGHGGYGGRY
ncbi:hypothetical protein AMS68_002700 [Peltaster fructicola]|uniref:5'-3' exoribonuclease n=1 Tax=Peltaster fructicola TaxID=286661 RepID=A0A6H0XR58_9PEZI|nr:hypothetical protein AMS68_002700 [Peltaster fructicola]